MLKNKLLAIFTFFVFAFLFIPLIIIFVTAFGGDSTIVFPIKSFSFKWFLNVFSYSPFKSSFIISIKIAFLGTVFALLVGIPTSYALARYSIKFKNVFKNFFLSPAIIPGIVVGFAMYQLMVVKLNISIFYGLLIGHFLICLPYVIRIVCSSLEQLDFSIEEVALSLGANKFKAFFVIVLPNISSGILSAFMLSFINSFNNIPVSMFLSGAGVTTFPTTLINYIEYYYDPTVSAISVLLMLATIIMMFIVEKTLGISALSK